MKQNLFSQIGLMEQTNNVCIVPTPFCFRRLLFITGLIAFWCAIAFSPCQAWEISAPAWSSVRLNGQHRVHMDDGPGFASPAYDDSSWEETTLPANANLLNEFRPSGVVWYRITFTLPAGQPPRQTALFLGRIGDADETYFNGVLVGSTGGAGREFIEAANVYRLYDIPGHLLRPGERNVVAVRTVFTQNYWGFFERDLALGDRDTLLVDTLRRAHVIEIFEACFITGLFLMLVACLFLYILGTRDPEYIFLLLFIAAYATFFILDSNTFYATGLKTPFTQRLVFTFLTLVSVCQLMFLTHACGRQLTMATRALLIILVVVAGSHLVTLPPVGSKLLFSVRMLALTASAAYYLFVAVKAWLDKKHEAGSILLGVLAYVTGSRMELMSGITLHSHSGLFLIDYATALFLICMMYAMTARFTRITDSLKHMTDQILQAHEEERKRIARDIHDVIGQGLLAIRLKLQMLFSQTDDCTHVSRGEFKAVIDDTSAYIDEVRRISMDLRPSFLDTMSFSDSLIWHAENVSRTSGIRIDVDADETGSIPITIKDNLYRIYQEAIGNAVKHSGADRIAVTLRTGAGLLRIEITDNGRGFDTSQSEVFQRGIGLETIQERAQLIGGRCAIRSSDRGTTITVEVNLP